MKKIDIYLAGASRHEDDEGQGWRLTLMDNWDDMGINLVNPIAYFSYSNQKHQSDKQVKQFFLSRLKRCDVVLVNLNNSDKSCGTCQEIQCAVDHDIPVIGFGNENVYNWLLVDCQCVFPTAEEAMQYIYGYYVL